MLSFLADKRALEFCFILSLLYIYNSKLMLMRSKYTVYLAIAIVTLFTNCTKELGPAAPSDKKDILIFKIEAAINKAVLKEDITGSISQDTINLVLPKYLDISKLIATFSTNGQSVFIDHVEQKSGVTSNDFSKNIQYTIKAENGSEKQYAISIKEKIPDWKAGVPHIYIQTENSAPIVSKDTYLNATIKIEGLGDYQDYSGKTKIKGRGNNTWSKPKKPYRLKLDKAASLLGLAPEKDWILLANWLDPTLMLNSIAMKTGHLLEMPYTNNIIPVDLTLNGQYIGSYAFTEQKEIGSDRIDLKEGGILLELDTYFDEPFKFKSKFYNLPVMVQYPELEDYPLGEANAVLAQIESDFNIMEKAVISPLFPDNNYLEYVDALSMVNYLIVFNLCQNEEINHPKSVYMHKHKGGKYKMGIIWDFDWAFDYENHAAYFTTYNTPLLWSVRKAEEGTHFFSRFMTDPVIKSLYKKEWTSFKSNKFPLLIKYLDEYSLLIKDSQQKDYAVWKRGDGNFMGDVQKLRTWLQNRASYMDTYVAGF